ncbi:propionyl-CoA synthetase [Rhizobium ruizarguesonis]|uniref:propionyl-CoA synthetase n=1 Tax=Rhizobium ruizarguesonis TaxID=2081791 RepID=UPI00102F9A6F|nr:propionyl-CoA synthetase [Rhizobium ruizarguesonis]NKJ75887.1 AMP-binding protein [Rhizobium leguminosarum bv. viciae]MBC2806192.1 propionyl-CoA synthetase [Rhizobium ruizarguesonis]NKQ72120.1 propionyl-CoA synthetase [Rhizobium ruizarguesonis]NKQ79956.1 propionyl-CoA synthetase [Rhizobium ruizarguesonis]QND22050.1 propionyl-CoA synthetase [Rhizobium leguminosarum bv. viciae]
MQNGYHQAYAAWKRDPEAFWREAAVGIDWFKPPERIFSPNEGVYGRWFSGAETNTCHNCLDRHVAAGRGGETAVIFDSAMNGEKRHFTYDEVLREVMAIAAALVECGIGKGDRVILYMPMVPQAVFSMLACARIGAVHSVVFGGFAASELAARIDDCGAKLVITASCGLEPGRIVAYKPLVDQAIEIAHSKPDRCLVLQRPELRADLASGRDQDFETAVARHRGAEIACVSVKATDPLYILYTSGTTGQPKGVVRDNGGHMVALNWSMRNIYGLKPGEVFWTASDIGWVVGHSYIVYAPLLSGVTTLIFEGKPVGTPDAGTFWRIVSEYQVRVLFTAPTAFRAIRREDGDGELMRQYPMPDLRALFLAGERADPETLKWAERMLGIPVIDHWWQTETGWPIAANPLGLGALPIKHGSPTLPMPGYDIAVLDDAGHPIEAGTLGNIVIKLPLPPGCLPTLWNADERFRSAYLDEFPGYYKTADAGYVDEDGYLFIMSRTDDIINCAGHRLSTGAMEEVCARHPDVAECAVIGVIDVLKGQAPCGFLVLKRHVSRDATAIESEVVAMIRDSIGPVAAFKTAITVNRLPKTRSGKILRGTMQKIADGIPWKMPATIDDPTILEEIAEALRGRGLGSLPM